MRKIKIHKNETLFWNILGWVKVNGPWELGTRNGRVKQLPGSTGVRARRKARKRQRDARRANRGA